MFGNSHYVIQSLFEIVVLCESLKACISVVIGELLCLFYMYLCHFFYHLLLFC